ncbi:endo-1,6-alpha-mannosidase [Lentinula raphanica]|nr:endo-1,6-alpha-mannosidase [Lentinula raphanica]
MVGLIFVVLLPSLVLGQNLSVPTTWRETNNTHNLTERISIAKSAINTILPQLNTSTAQFDGIGYWQSANVFASMANFDHFANSTTYKSKVIDGLTTAFRLYPNFDLNHIRGKGSFHRTCLVYHTQWPIRTRACCRWPSRLGTTSLTSDVVTKADAQSGTQPNKNFTIASTCYGETMAGGVFWRPTIDDQGINSITTGLSAFLAETTSNATYKNAAILSAQWIQNLQISDSGIVLDGVNAVDCTRTPASWLFTYNSGKYLEGLSVLKDITGAANWKSLMTNITAAAVKSPVWQGSNGIITEGASTTSDNDGVGFKAIFIRGLEEVNARSLDNSNLQTLIESYIDVQYNALLDLAANGTSYSPSWPGPAQQFTSWGQMAALDVMVSVVNSTTP